MRRSDRAETTSTTCLRSACLFGRNHSSIRKPEDSETSHCQTWAPSKSIIQGPVHHPVPASRHCNVSRTASDQKDPNAPGSCNQEWFVRYISRSQSKNSHSETCKTTREHEDRRHPRGKTPKLRSNRIAPCAVCVTSTDRKLIIASGIKQSGRPPPAARMTRDQYFPNKRSCVGSTTR